MILLKPGQVQALRNGFDKVVKEGQARAFSEIGDMLGRAFRSGGEGGSTFARAGGSADEFGSALRNNLPDSGQIDYRDVMKQTLEQGGENPNYVDDLFN